jgi:hypothetical protein
MKQTLTFVARYTKDKMGNPLMTKTGKPYVSIRVKTNEHGDKFISGFGNAQNENWKVGDEVEMDIEQKGEYLNFTMPKPTDVLKGDLETVKIDIERIYREVFAIRETLVMLRQLMEKAKVIPSNESAEYPDEINPEDIPF